MGPRTPPPSSTRGHLILVGLPGAGKTTVGRAVAARLGWGFLDFDEEIERREGMRVRELFSRRGERHFRSLERSLTEELSASPPMVLAPGGGWIMIPGAMALLRPPGRIIHLRVRPETALGRLTHDLASRPLLQGTDTLGQLQRLLEIRRSAYDTADAAIDVDLIGVEEVTDLVLRVAGGGRGASF